MDPDAAGGFLHPGSNFQEDTVYHHILRSNLYRMGLG